MPRPTPARFGSLEAEAARDVRLLVEFMEAREARMRALFGRQLRPNPTRDDLIRRIVLNFSDQKILSVSEYIRLFASYASAPTIRAEITLLSEAGLVILRGGSARRSPKVCPASRLIDFYNHQIPRLRAEFHKAFADGFDHLSLFISPP